MPVLTFDEFGGGLDVRPAFALSRANILRVLTNAYVTTGKSIKKRPCLEKIATLEAGTVGLKSFAGKLNTFYGAGAAIAHADTRFVARRVPHITTGVAPTKIHYADQYNALLYVAAEYGDGTFRHHYLDDPGAWANATNYTLSTYRRPTVANGFRYKVTAVAGTGTSGGVEPVWPTTIGAAVIDNAGVNQLTWTCHGFDVEDVNCPHTKQVAKQAQKMYAVGVDATTVRYCKTGNPRDWTTASDAGFIAAGLYARGSDQVTAINLFGKSSLAVFFSDNAQLWAADPAPANILLTSNIEGIGTVYARAAGPVSQDLFFKAQTGFRSMSLVVITNNLQDNDVGSAIDALVNAQILSTDDPLSLYYPKLGQFWCINGSTVWAYSFSRTSKLSAWSKFTLPFTINDACVLNQELYVRTGDDVYKVSDAVYKDGVSSIPLVDIQMYAQDARSPGVLKQFMAMDVIGTGKWTISQQWYDPEIAAWRETDSYEYPAITEPGNLHPVELLATRIAPHIQHQKDEAFEISALSLLYEKLGPV
ncbi:MAG: hypothetical protein EPO20_14875 [Betaproteobacteria bacterium]|nr:MAG: hypothetical protein EPO20_14875 [Betaproteobacteria bacterium]